VRRACWARLHLCRRASLAALKRGFDDAALGPALGIWSATELRALVHGYATVPPASVYAGLTFVDAPPASAVPDGLRFLLLSGAPSPRAWGARYGGALLALATSLAALPVDGHPLSLASQPIKIVLTDAPHHALPTARPAARVLELPDYPDVETLRLRLEEAFARHEA